MKNPIFKRPFCLVNHGWDAKYSTFQVFRWQAEVRHSNKNAAQKENEENQKRERRREKGREAPLTSWGVAAESAHVSAEVTPAAKAACERKNRGMRREARAPQKCSHHRCLTCVHLPLSYTAEKLLLSLSTTSSSCSFACGGGGGEADRRRENSVYGHWGWP